MDGLAADSCFQGLHTHTRRPQSAGRRIRLSRAGTAAGANPIAVSPVPYGITMESRWRMAPQEYTTLGT